MTLVPDRCRDAVQRSSLGRVAPDRAHRRRHERDQRGATLLELLLTLALAVIILGPLTAWTFTTVRQQGRTGAQLANAVSTGRVSSAFVEDVASARMIDAPGNDCLGGSSTPGGGGAVRLSIRTAGVDQHRIVYSEARPEGAPSGDPRRSLWRRECDSAGLLIGSTELFAAVQPGSVAASCPIPTSAPPPAVPIPPPCQRDAARRVRLSFTPAGPSASPRPIELTATRRANADSIGIPGSGNRPPVAQIDVDSLVGNLGVPFRFSGLRSEDLDGTLTDASFRWEFPAASGTVERTGRSVDHAFTEVGEHTVLLEITDAEGAQNVAAVTVRVDNRHPTAAAQVSPETGVVGTTLFRFDAGTSADPDGDALTYAWNLGVDAANNPIVDSRRVVDLTFPAGTPVGPRRISLTVTDSRGGSDVLLLQIGLAGTVPVTGITITPEPVLTGGVPVVGTVGVGRPDVPVEFGLSGAPGAETWRLTTAAGAAVASGPGANMLHTFRAGDHGEYRIARVDGAGQVVGTQRSFRVNAAPVAGFTTSGGSTDWPRTVDFSSAGAGGSSDGDGRIVAWRWTFGFFSTWMSSAATPTQVFTHPGRYQVRLEVVDDDGATSSVQQVVEVTGPVAAPPPPTWAPDEIRLTAVPGAERYRVTVTCAGAPLVVPGSEFAATAAPVLALPAGTCAAPAVAAASYQLLTAGVWSPSSTPVQRP